jgi:DNA-binding NarL/FixJ family response regulator
MHCKVLVVEDSPVQLDDIEQTLLDVSREQRKRVGLEGFVVRKANCASKARELLLEASNAGEPYHLLLLDLGLPEEATDADEDPRRGLSILEMAQANKTATEIIIYSVFSDYEYVVDAFRGGAVDFLDKGCEPEELQLAVLRAWSRVLEKESIVILDTRIKTLVPYAEKGLAYALTTCFSRLMRAVKDGAEGLRGDLRHRLGVDLRNDSQDVLAARLFWMEKEGTEAKAELTALQEALIGTDESGEVVVEELFKQLRSVLGPILVVKQIDLNLPESSQTRVLTFGNDVQAVLREIILGVLSQVPDYGEARTQIDVKVELKDTKAEIRFSDNLTKRIPKAAADSINRGLSSMVPDTAFGREWGLSVAQHVALRGGGRLQVNPSDLGNIITCFIPLAHP